MSPANVHYLLRNNSYVDPATVEVCPNSIEPLDIRISEQERNEIRAKHDVPSDKLIYVYGGNLGKPQGVSFLIDCIKGNENNERSFFLIVGSGTEFQKIKNYFNEENPKNAKLLHQLSKSDYDLLVGSCDVGLIFLDSRFTIPNFPSRVLSYMQASMPILAATDINTDVGDVIVRGNFGFWGESGDLNTFNQHVKQLYDKNLRVRLGRNARSYLEENFTVKHSYEIIMKHFNDDEE